MHRAYSVMEVKRLGEQSDSVTLEGIASTPTPDKAGDIVNPMGARFKLPMPLLQAHKHDLPVGRVTYACPTHRGIPFTARIPRIKTPGLLKDRVDEAIHSLEAGLIAACSVGFTPVAGKAKRLPGGGIQFDEWEWHELSICVIGMNDEAVISVVKSMGPASTAGPLPQEFIRQCRMADYQSGRQGVALETLSTAAREGVRLIPR